MVDIVEADVKSDWASKINWTQVAQIGFSLGALFGLDVSPEQKAQILAGINGVAGLATIIMRTWFTTKLTASSAAKV